MSAANHSPSSPDIAFSPYPQRATAERQAELLKALGHPTRLLLLRELSRSPHSVSELSLRLSLAQSRVSQQLSLLRHQSLVSSSRQRGFAVYRLAEPRLRSLLDCLDQCCPPSHGAAAGSAP